MIESIMNLIGDIASLIAIAVALFSAITWWRQLKRQKILDNKITLHLIGYDDQLDQFRYKIPFPIVRRHCRRSEVLGVIGMIPTNDPDPTDPKKGMRYSIAYLNTEDFWEALNEIQTGKRKVLLIKTTPEERSVFDLESLPESRSRIAS